MARGKRRHPTESIGISEPRVMPEINTVHAFGMYGNETSGWPFSQTARIGTAVGGTRIYRSPRASQDELGGGKSRRRKRKGRRR